MGRFFDPNEELDRADLNKCPDCSCFFGGETCPLCGKPCPEEMRAGNRKPVKHPKRRKSGNSSGRVTFIEWYHSWWFILLMMFFFPLVGIILFATSPYKKTVKITVCIIAAVYLLVTFFGLGNIIGRITGLWDKPVDTSLSKSEYMQKCEEIDPEAFYRASGEYEEEFVCVTLRVKYAITDSDGAYSGDKYTTYYICEALDGKSFEILVLDCNQEGTRNFISGDVIKLYGEGAGNKTVYDEKYEVHTAPCIHMAYAEVLN